MLHSLSAQVSYYSKMIQSHNGWMYCGVYSDEAVTGTKRERAGFQHMIEECRQGNIDLVINLPQKALLELHYIPDKRKIRMCR